MPPQLIFLTQTALGYAAWILCATVYILPKLKSMEPFEAQRAIATLHSFRFLGLVFILPGVVGPNLPASFTAFAADGDLATGILALLALATAKIRPLFWTFVVAFNLIGATDLFLNYLHATRAALPLVAGQLGAAYFIIIVLVPLLTITHAFAFYLMLRPHPPITS